MKPSRCWAVTMARCRAGTACGTCSCPSATACPPPMSTPSSRWEALHACSTGLRNRPRLRDRLPPALFIGDRDTTSVALLIMDLDRFKDVNDTLGHHTGDELLQQVGLRLRSAVRASDTVARMGGDEFAIVLPMATHAQTASNVAETLVKALEEPFSLAGHAVSVG